MHLQASRKKGTLGGGSPVVVAQVLRTPYSLPRRAAPAGAPTRLVQGLAQDSIRGVSGGAPACHWPASQSRPPPDGRRGPRPARWAPKSNEGSQLTTCACDMHRPPAHKTACYALDALILRAAPHIIFAAGMRCRRVIKRDPGRRSVAHYRSNSTSRRMRVRTPLIHTK